MEDRPYLAQGTLQLQAALQMVPQAVHKYNQTIYPISVLHNRSSAPMPARVPFICQIICSGTAP